MTERSCVIGVTRRARSDRTFEDLPVWLNITPIDVTLVDALFGTMCTYMLILSLRHIEHGLREQCSRLALTQHT